MTTDYWASVLRDTWGIEAALTRLDGEYDLNFLAEAPSGQGYILKAMRPGCAPSLVEMQTQALEHMAATELPFPKVIRTSDGAAMASVSNANGGTRIVWLLARLPGTCYANAAPKTLQLIGELGSILGRTAQALQAFEHPELHKAFKWNLMQAGWIRPELSCIINSARRLLLEGICEEFSKAEAELAALPRQAIHNDANDYNILVADNFNAASHVSGIIDFGDMCAAPKICDLAIAAAYVVLDHPQPERALAALIAGYHTENSLTEQEVALIWPLLRMRLAVSVVNSTLMSAEYPDDPYITISQAPAWRFLEAYPLEANLVTARLQDAIRRGQR